MAWKRLGTNQRQRIKELVRKEKDAAFGHTCIRCFACSFFVNFPLVTLLVSFFGFCLAIMAHPSSYVSVPSDRSRSRDDPPMWSHRTPDRPRDPRHHETWNYTPMLRQTRRVLVIIDLTQVQYLMSARRSDVMQATTCEALPLGRLEQYALFTYSFLLAPAQTQITTVDTILHYISQNIKNIWGFYLAPSSMDPRWSDCTGDTFALRNHQILIDLLREHRPHWTEGQEFGILNEIRDFDNPSQPYTMRMSCHERP